MTAAQKDRRTHKGTDSETQEETDRQNSQEGEPRGQPADGKKYTVLKKDIIFLATYFILLNVFIGCSADFLL